MEAVGMNDEGWNNLKILTGFFWMFRRPRCSAPLPYATLFRSASIGSIHGGAYMGGRKRGGHMAGETTGADEGGGVKKGGYRWWGKNRRKTPGGIHRAHS